MDMEGAHLGRTKEISVNERCLVSSVCVPTLMGSGRQTNHSGDGGTDLWRRNGGRNLICCSASPACLYCVQLCP